MTTAEPPTPDHRRASYYRVLRRRRRWPTYLGWSLFAIVAIALSAALYPIKEGYRALSNPENQSAAVKLASKHVDPHVPNQPYNILLIGSDKRAGKAGQGDPGRSDSLIFVRLDFRNNSISLLSFPRDLYVNVPGHGFNKINAAYSYGGPDLTLRTIKEITGEPINYFFNLDFQGFIKLVDSLGGVYLDVDRHYYHSNAGLFGSATFSQIDIKPGYQLLNGTNALAYVRYRHYDSDFARAARQQQFLTELKRQMSLVFDESKIVDVMQHYVTTNLKDFQKLKNFLQLALTIDKSRIYRVSITGQDEMRPGAGSVVITSPGTISKAVDEWKNPTFVNAPSARPHNPGTVSIAVQNGSGRLLAAQDGSDALRAKGYDAYGAGDAPGESAHSGVFYAPGHHADAQAVQALLGEQSGIRSRVAGQPTDADLVVVIGSDFTGHLRAIQKERPAVVLPHTIATTSAVPVIATERRATGMKLLVPLQVASGSALRYVRHYNVDHGDRGKPNAVTLVFDGGEATVGGRAYWTITQTSKKNPTILEGATGVYKHRYSQYYDGKNIIRVAWQNKKTGMTYWISNTLGRQLSAETLRAVANSMVPPRRARLKRGQRDSAIPVAYDGVTP